MGNKEYKEIRVDISNGTAVFFLPKLPALHALYVEEFNPGHEDENKWELIWGISFIGSNGAEKQNVNDNVVYGVVPDGATASVASKSVRPLKVGVLYSVSMDVGNIVASGYFLIEKGLSGLEVRNLTRLEAQYFQLLPR